MNIHGLWSYDYYEKEKFNKFTQEHDNNPKTRILDYKSLFKNRVKEKEDEVTFLNANRKFLKENWKSFGYKKDVDFYLDEYNKHGNLFIEHQSFKAYLEKIITLVKSLDLGKKLKKFTEYRTQPEIKIKGNEFIKYLKKTFDGQSIELVCKSIKSTEIKKALFRISFLYDKYLLPLKGIIYGQSCGIYNEQSKIEFGLKNNKEEE